MSVRKLTENDSFTVMRKLTENDSFTVMTFRRPREILIEPDHDSNYYNIFDKYMHHYVGYVTREILAQYIDW